MGTAATSDAVPAPEGGTGFDDPFHDPLGIVFVLWGTVHHTPSWGANSFPPPIVH